MGKKHDLQFDEFASDIVTGGQSGYVELPISQRVFMLVGIASALVALIAFGRIGFLNIGRAAFYEQRSEANVNREIAVPAHRGLIVDREGKVLAKNAETFSIFLNAADLLKDRYLLSETLVKLAASLETTPQDLLKILEDEDFETKTSVAIARNISSEAAIAIRGLGLPAVTVENDFRREYVGGAAFSHVIGYTGLADEGSAVVGKTGIEKAYDEILRGADGQYVYYRDAVGQILDEGTTKEAVAGRTLETTIDAELQTYFYTRLKRGLEQLGVRGAVGLALDTRTSEVLSLVSFPDFDNNVFVTPGNSLERQKLITDRGRPLFNRAITGEYNPGSTIKTLVALAGLKEKVVDPIKSIFSAGYIEIPNPYFPDKPSRFLDWKAHGWVDVRSALARSSNVYFYAVGGGFEDVKGLGIKKLKEYWQKLQFGQSTGLDIGPEADGFLPDPEEKEQRTDIPWRLGDTYNVSIGQGDFLVTPIQLLNFISSIANGGKIYQPRLVRRVADNSGNLGMASKPTLLFDYSSWQSEVRQVQIGMQDAVSKDYGTAHLLASIPMSIAGKTGSAQIQNNTKTNAFFVGYAPAEAAPSERQVAILVLIEDAREGSLNAVPIAKDVLEWWYNHRIANEDRISE